MQEILVPIFVCVVLPVSIVLIIYLNSVNKTNKQAALLMKAMEVNKDFDADKLAEAFRAPLKSAKEIANVRLLRGCIFSLVGFVLFLYGVLADCILKENDAEDMFFMSMFGACVFVVGLSYLIVYFVSLKALKREAKED